MEIDLATYADSLLYFPHVGYETYDFEKEDLDLNSPKY